MIESHFDKGYKELRKMYDEKFGKGENPGFSRERLAFELTAQDLKENLWVKPQEFIETER